MTKIKWGYIILLILLAFENAYANVIPTNADTFRFEREIFLKNKLHSTYTIEKTDKIELLYSVINKKTDKPHVKNKKLLKISDFREFIIILNYIGFNKLPNSIRNNRRTQIPPPKDRYSLTYLLDGKIFKKKLRCDMLEFEGSSQEEMFKLTFINLFLESHIKYRNNDGSIKYWR